MKLGERCYAVTGLTHADLFPVNSGFIVGKDGTILLDSGFSTESAPTIEGYAAAASGGKPIQNLILLEGHLDHIFAAGYFRSKGADIIAYQGIGLTQKEIDDYVINANDSIGIETRRDNREAFLYFDQVKPFVTDIAVKEDTTLTLCGCQLEVYLAPGHTKENIMVYEPHDRVLYAADTMYHRYLLTARFGNAKLWQQWLETLDLIEKLSPRFIVPGHGRVIEESQVKAALEHHRRQLYERLNQ